MSQKKELAILGTRGIPAAHGGFETFAQELALYLVAKSWDVTVYCQVDGFSRAREDSWEGVKLVHVSGWLPGTLGTILFDLKSILHSLRRHRLTLTLGYNTAIFSTLQKLAGRTNLINMDGIEWKREKWGRLARIWFRANEWIACRVGTHLIADNPGIESHLLGHVNADRVTMIAYGAPEVASAKPELLESFGIQPDLYAVVIARPEPENSILEIVQSFSTLDTTHKLVVLGSFEPEKSIYHRQVIEAAGEGVIFPGAIYDKETLQALRYFATVYLHGHRVGGTNPSLVEALGAGNAVVAHDNQFNRWVASDSALYFTDSSDLPSILEQLFIDAELLASLKGKATANYQSRFTWELILKQYETLLGDFG